MLNHAYNVICLCPVESITIFFFFAYGQFQMVEGIAIYLYQGFQYFSSVPVFHYFKTVLFIKI